MLVARLTLCLILSLGLGVQGSQRDGCPYTPGYDLFQTKYPSHNPALTWGWTILSEPEVVANKVGWPTYRWMPDGHLSAIKNDRTGDWMIFYPNHESYRTLGPHPLPDKSRILSPRHKIIGGKLHKDVYNNGGMWLMSVHMTGPGGQMIGFVHTEDQFYDNGFPSSGMAFKSVALACSSDYGVSWDIKGRILTLGEKPARPGWSGTGDQDVVWDWKNGRWFMATHMSAAVSYSKSAEQSSWKKWDGSNFTRGSLVQDMEKLRDPQRHFLPSGANPSIHWNLYLQKWVMVYHGWDWNIYITTASDLPNFEEPRVLLEDSRDKNWYPTLLSWKFGDRLGQRAMFLYYRHFPDVVGGKRTAQFMKMKIKFCRDNHCQS